MTITTTAAQLIATAILPAREFTVNIKGNYVTFESNFMDDTAWDLLEFVPGYFAKSLHLADKLSDKQLAWVHKLAVDYAAQLASENNTETVDFAALFDATLST